METSLFVLAGGILAIGAKLFWDWYYNRKKGYNTKIS